MATTKIQSGAFPADVVTTAAIDDLGVTHAKLHTTMDLSSKTVTLPTLSTLTTTGNVGIGNDSPSAPLHIKKSISSTYTGGNTGIVNSLFNITNTLSTSTVNAQANIQLGVYDGTHNRVTGIAAVAESATNRKASLVFWTDDENTRSEKLRITGDGNVGIGTADPAHKFHINQPGNSPQMRISGNANWDFYSYNDTNFYVNNASGTVLGLLGNRNAYFSKNLSIGDSVLSTYHANYPALDIGSSASVQGYTGNNGVWLQSNLFMNTNGQWTSKSDDYSAMLELYDGNFNFYNTASGTGTRTLLTPMTIRQNGNVGIGTATPTSELHVHGRLSGGELGNTDIVRKDLHFYVDFNDKSCVSGTSATEAPLDLSPARYNLTLHGGANFEHKDGIGTYYFDGLDDHININNFVVADSSNTYEVWHYSNSQSGWETFWDSGTERPLLGLNADQLKAYPSGTAFATIDTGKWYHIVFAFASNNDLDVYVNGHRVNEAHNWNHVQRTGTFQFWLGGDTTHEGTNGWIGVARAYTRQLTEQEVKQNYNAEVSRFATVTPSLGIVQSNNNVGIGTSSPDAPLQVGAEYIGRPYIDIIGHWRATQDRGEVVAASDGGGMSYTHIGKVVKMTNAVGSHSRNIGEVRLTPGKYYIVVTGRPTNQTHAWTVYGTNSNGFNVLITQNSTYNSGYGTTYASAYLDQTNKDQTYAFSKRSEIMTVTSTTTYGLAVQVQPYGAGGYQMYVTDAKIMKLS